MYTIKNLARYDFVPFDDYYKNDDWYVDVSEFLKAMLVEFWGNRELIVDFDLIHENWEEIENGTFTQNILTPKVKGTIDLLFKMNRKKYQKLYDVLNAEYNPLWNVDGKETLEYERTNSGTVKDEGSDTGTVKDEGSDTGTIGYDKKNTGTVSDVGSNTGTTTEAQTSYDSATFYDSKQTTNNLSNGNTRTDNLSEVNTQTNNLASANTRTDNLKHDNLRTDNLKETYKESKVRGGNIGVTMSQQLVEAEVELREKFNFTEMVCKDVVEAIAYGVY